MRTHLLNTALRFTAAGRRVFPVARVPRPDGTYSKKPMISGYRGAVPYSARQVAAMPWGRASWVGLALYPGEVALDVDVKGDKAGAEHLRVLCDAYGELPSTVTQHTPSGGEHHLFLAEVPTRVKGRLDLPDGHPADIDLVHHGYRFLVLYQPDRVLTDLNHPARLPATWLPAIVKTTGSGQQRPRPATRLPSAVPELIDLVRQATDHRNDTLNGAVFTAVMTGECGRSELGDFRDAALGAGLDPDEVDATIDSAVAAGWRCWSEPRQWYEALVEQLDSFSPRLRATLQDAAAELALIAAHTGKQTSVDESVRALASALGVSTSTASTTLGRLLQGGWVTASDAAPGKGRTFKLVLPASENPYTHPALTPAEVPAVYAGCDPTAPGGDHEAAAPAVSKHEPAVFDKVTGVRRRLRRLPAFQASRGELSLPPAALAVAAELSVEPRTVTVLTERTGLGRDTIRGALLALESTGIVHVAGEIASVAAPDVEGAFAQWARSMGIPDRAQLRQERHAAEREAFGPYLAREAARDAERRETWQLLGEPWQPEEERWMTG